jgi:glycosyltransferase involved in cell wall biosynthesis
MKIFSYLASGRSIMATNIPSHTQVLDASCALLVDPTPAAMAQGLSRLAADPGLREDMGKTGQSLSRSRYSFARFQTTVKELYQLSGPLFD